MAKSATELKETDYVHPEVLVDTQWVADHGNDPKVKIVEVDVDTNAYETGHIKGAIGLDWRKDLPGRSATCSPRTRWKPCFHPRESATTTR